MSRLYSKWMLVVLAIVLPSTLLAQTSSPWSLEASFIYNFQSYDFEQAHQTVDTRVDHEREVFTDRKFEDIQKIESKWAPDLKVGFRYYGLYFGFLYSQSPEQTIGYTSFYETAQGSHFQENQYEVVSKTREYMLSLGYYHQILPRLSLGAIGSIGWGIASGSVLDPFGMPGTSQIKADIEGDYTPARLEVRAKVQLTKYIDFDFGAGWRSSVASEMVADYGLTLGTYPVTIYSTSDTRVAEFDWSGPIYGAGITLKNPYGSK